MYFVTASRWTLKRPHWIIANFVETSQAAADNALKGYDRVKKTKKEKDKKMRTDLIPSTRNEHSYSNAIPSPKVQRDAFGATILPSNLSFDNMKKLSMNQIKLEDIPFIDESGVTEILIAEKMSKAKGGESSSPSPEQQNPEVVKEVENSDSSLTIAAKRCKTLLDFSKTDPFEKIPGPRLLDGVSSATMFTVRHMTVFFLLRLLRNGGIGLLRKYGPIVKLPEILGGKMLLVNRPEHISAIYGQDERRPMSSSLDVLECSRIRRHGRHRNECPLNEAEWDETRKAIDDVLLKDEEQYFESLEENGNHLVRRIRGIKTRENEVPGEFDLEVNKWCLECLFQILFDKSFGFMDADTTKWPSKNAQLLAALRQATRELEVCENGLQLWRFMKTTASVSLDTACQTIETILSHYVYQAQMDLLNKDDHPKSSPLTLTEGLLLLDGMTKADVITYLLDTLLIGMNAMTSALAFVLYHLAKNPRVQNELFKEVKEILPEKYSRLEWDQLGSMKYLEACLKESLRLKMPMPILMKYLNRDVILSNYQVPRGTLVLMPAQAEALRDENFEKAQEFRPGRWLETESKISHTSIPLSVHSQKSFETRLAEISVMTCVAQIVRNFIVEYNYGTLSASNSTVSYPTSPLKFAFIEREM